MNKAPPYGSQGWQGHVHLIVLEGYGHIFCLPITNAISGLWMPVHSVGFFFSSSSSFLSNCTYLSLRRWLFGLDTDLNISS